ncbi:MAG: hypothetical protein ABIQ16_00125 [Polyangiaceae bacterium]
MLPEIAQLGHEACAHSQVIGPVPQVDCVHILLIVPLSDTEQT